MEKLIHLWHTHKTLLTFVSPEKSIMSLQILPSRDISHKLLGYIYRNIDLFFFSITRCMFPGPWRWCNVWAGAAYLYVNYLCKIQMAFSWQILSLQGNCSFPALISLNWFLGNNESSNSTIITDSVSDSHLLDRTFNNPDNSTTRTNPTHYGYLPFYHYYNLYWHMKVI